MRKETRQEKREFLEKFVQGHRYNPDKHIQNVRLLATDLLAATSHLERCRDKLLAHPESVTRMRSYVSANQQERAAGLAVAAFLWRHETGAQRLACGITWLLGKYWLGLRDWRMRRILKRVEARAVAI